MNNKRKGQGGDGEGGERHPEDAAASNRGKGKVPRKNAGAEDADDDAAGGDAAMGEAEDETKAMAEDAKGVCGSNKKAEEKKNQGSTTKTFAVMPCRTSATKTYSEFATSKAKWSDRSKSSNLVNVSSGPK